VSSKFKPGDLIILNQYGLFIVKDFEEKVGVVITKSYNILTPAEPIPEPVSFYAVYDILLDGELFKMVPEEFMEKYKKYEKDTE